MQLLTSRFGKVDFQPAELLIFEHGLLSFPRDRQWILLADSAHPRLFWLQSVSNSSVAIPVTDAFNQEVRVAGEICRRLQISNVQDITVLAPLCRDDDQQVSIEWHFPIIVNCQTGRCCQLRYQRHDTKNHPATSLSSVLRQSA